MKMKINKVFETLRSDKSRDMWSEIRKIKGRKSMMVNMTMIILYIYIYIYIYI